MSKRAWLIFFWSMGLALLPAQSQPARNSNAAQLQSSVTKTKTASATASLPIEVRQDLHAIAGALKAANAKPPSSTDERNASAQEKVARLTPKMIGIAAIEAAITLVGVILVAFTLQATRQTKNEAKRAADAAHATLAHMQSNAKMELRAYLSVEPLGIAALTIGHEQLGMWP